jgi:hypothetical protein
MWQPLSTSEQLFELSRLRQTLLDGDFRHETIFQVTRVGQFYFMAQAIEQNGIQILVDRQIITPYRINGLIYYGFEIWED